MGKVTRPIGAEFDGLRPMVEIAVEEHIFDPYVRLNISGYISNVTTEKFIDFANSATGL